MTANASKTSDVEARLAALSDDSLLAMVRNDSAALDERLYACEVLLRRDQRKFLRILEEPMVAVLYVRAFASRIADLNAWAFLGMGDLGPMGQHLVACGDSAVRELISLLNVVEPAGLYAGSKEAKLGNSDRSRICDFAAFFICRIRGLPYAFHRDHIALRDAEIERLKKGLRP